MMRLGGPNEHTVSNEHTVLNYSATRMRMEGRRTSHTLVMGESNVDWTGEFIRSIRR